MFLLFCSVTTTQRPLNDPFADLDPHDGLRISQVQLGDQVSLFAQMLLGGNPTAQPQHLLSVSADDPAQVGRLVRLRLLTEAIARYLNTGGSWQELYHVAQQLRLVLPQGLHFPGYYYRDGYPTTEGTYQHVFAQQGTDQAVVWEEPVSNDAGGMCGGFIERTSLAELEDIHDERPEPRIIFVSSEKTAPVQLPDRLQLEAARPVERNSERVAEQNAQLRALVQASADVSTLSAAQKDTDVGS